MVLTFLKLDVKKTSHDKFSRAQVKSKLVCLETYGIYFTYMYLDI